MECDPPCEGAVPLDEAGHLADLESELQAGLVAAHSLVRHVQRMNCSQLLMEVELAGEKYLIQVAVKA